MKFNEDVARAGLSNRATGILVCTAIGIYGRFPAHWRSKAGSAFGKCIPLLFPSFKKKVERRVLEYIPDADAEGVVRGMFSELGKSVAEWINHKSLIASPKAKFHIANQDVIDTALAQNRSILALSAHVSNWELLAAHFGTLGVPVIAVGADDGRSPFMVQFLDRIRKLCNVETLWLRTNFTGRMKFISDLQSLLRRQSIIAVLVDLDLEGKGVKSSFFGKSCFTPDGLIKLAKRENAIVSFCFMHRIEDLEFELHIEVLPDELSIKEIVDKYNQSLERIVRQNPDQWLWMHDRWAKAARAG